MTNPGWKEEVEDGELLEGEERTAYRALAARVNYLAQDRPDIQYQAKEICRQMQKLRESIEIDVASFVTIELPAISFEGHEVPGLSMKVKRCLDCKLAVSVELRPDVLTYIRIAMLDSFERGSNKRQRAEHDGRLHKIRWCNSRQAFIAQRPGEGGRRKLKIFKPNGSLSLIDATDKANAWPDADNESSDESDDNVEEPSPAVLDVQPADGSNEQEVIAGPAIDAAAFGA